MTSHDDMNEAMNEAIRTAFSATRKPKAPPEAQGSRRLNADAGEGNRPENEPESGGAWAKVFNDAVRKAARR